MSDPLSPDTPDALVIGAGPAGLMAAEAMAGAGLSVTVAEAMPTVGRKFLMAGKSGLNLTKDEPLERFLGAYDPPGWLDPMLRAFGPAEVQGWARGLGQEVFTGTSGRVFPVAMKASPLLRAWLARLGQAGVRVETRWRWTGFANIQNGFAKSGGFANFITPSGPVTLRPRVTVLALGGASWRRLGSDGEWATMLSERGVEVAPFAPANMGFRVEWSPQMARHFGQPVKGVALVLSTGRRERGEFVVSARGLEGGGIYAISRDLREGAGLVLDIFPDLPVETLAKRLAGRQGESMANRLRKAGLSPVAQALAQEWGRPLPPDPLALSRLLKDLPVPIAGPRPMDEAISTAGGITRDALTEGLELRALPGVFACGEMLDWEAPTGGYLLTGCLATGLWAGRAAAALAKPA